MWRPGSIYFTRWRARLFYARFLLDLFVFEVAVCFLLPAFFAAFRRVFDVDLLTRDEPLPVVLAELLLAAFFVAARETLLLLRVGGGGASNWTGAGRSTLTTASLSRADLARSET